MLINKYDMNIVERNIYIIFIKRVIKILLYKNLIN